MKRRLRAFASPWFLVPLLLILTVDLFSKSWAFDYVDLHRDPRYSRPRVVVIEDYLLLAQELNTGTLWGLAREHTYVLILLRVVILGFLCWLLVGTQPKQRWRRLGLGLVLGGALGNLYDNLTRADRAVRDFIDVKIPLPWGEPPHDFYDYPVFNVADSAVLVGAIVLFLAFGRPPAKEEARDSARGAEPSS